MNVAPAKAHVRPLSASIVVDCPRSAAIEWVQRYFDDRQHVVSIGLPLRALGIPTFVRIYRNVRVELHSVAIRTPYTPRVETALHVAWHVTHGGPFPTFSGVLTARARATQATLHFEGTYEPPFRLAGTLFDRILGHQIAQASVETLLHDIKRFIERLSIEEHHATSFAAFEANLRDEHPSGFYGVPLHGSIAVRRDGSYLACSLVIEGDAPDFDRLTAGSYRLSETRIRELLADLAKPDLHVAAEPTAT